jgi:hypothetical protein
LVFDAKSAGDQRDTHLLLNEKLVYLGRKSDSFTFLEHLYGEGIRCVGFGALFWTGPEPVTTVGTIFAANESLMLWSHKEMIRAIFPAEKEDSGADCSRDD